MTVEMNDLAADYDVIVIGGALSGSATATLLLRQNPGIRILIVEKSEKLERRVGEATVEVSGYFLTRVLDMTGHLNEKHLAKQGLRFWFTNDDVHALDESSEIGARYLARLPSWQIDRSIFDEEVLRKVGEAGAEIIRPAIVSNIQLVTGGWQTLDLRQDGKKRSVRARWLVDASGINALLARKNDWLKPNTEHPTAAVWGRWQGVKDWDSRELAEKFPDWGKSIYGLRNTATNHLIGDGWWCWFIPLKGGEVSIGIVYDRRLVDFPQEGKLGDRMRKFLERHAVARELLERAEYVPGDMHQRKNLAYSCSTIAGDGFVLVGDAAGFIDPFYSPGMDWISYTSSRAARLITDQREGLGLSEKTALHNRDFSVCYQRWFEALYRNKYEYLGEFDLLNLAFRFDLSLYYWGVVEVPYNRGEDALLAPPFSPPSGRWFAALMRTYNGRFAKIARRRRQMGLLGRHNAGRRYLIPGFTLDRKDTLRIFSMLGEWALLELKEGWRSWGRDRAERRTPVASWKPIRN